MCHPDQIALILCSSKTTDMKTLLKLSLVLLPLFALNSCNSDDDGDVFGIDDLPGTYVGVMNVGSFENLQYTVTVSKVSATTVRITPSTGVATEWTASLSKVLGVYTCI